MLVRNRDGEVVEVTKKAYSVLYRYRGWEIVKDEKGKPQSLIEEVVDPDKVVAPEEIPQVDEALNDVEEVAEGEVEEVPEEEEKIDVTNLLKADLQAMLSEKGIEFNPKDNKAKLLELLGY